MEKYLGVKLIEARECRGYNNKCYNDNDMYPTEALFQDGYKVVYEDGYTSWSPKDVFEKAYRKIDNLTFGLAVEALKLGKRVAREGWNGKGMWVVKQNPVIIGENVIPKMQSLPDSAKEALLTNFNKTIYYRNQMLLVQPDGTADSWVASSSDIFAEDWMILE